MRRQGMMRMPAREVSRAPVLKLILPGARLTRALAGATMLAAMFVDRVATSRPAHMGGQSGTNARYEMSSYRQAV